MNEPIKVLAIVLTLFLGVGAFLYFTRRNRKLQYSVLFPLLLVLTLSRGFVEGWRTRDYIDLGIVLFVCFWVWWSLFRRRESKN
jgi:hypothetical protein